MTCKDCIHFEVCPSKDQVIRPCYFFKDRARFVELPPDGVMYGVLNGKPVELSNFISPPKGNELFILSPETVNVPFYKTREKAEQALKERE